jgi:hypothetical protein
MKKNISIILIMILVLTSCGKKDESITLTKEAYDELYASQLENDDLRLKVQELEEQLEAISSSETEVENSETTISEATESEAESGTKLSPDEIAKLTLTPYIGAYELVGFKDQDNHIILVADFDSATPFENGKATITRGGKIGTLDARGQITWIKTDTYKPYRVQPVNDIQADSDFGKFIAEFENALDSKDSAYILAHMHPNAKLSFGGATGLSGMQSYWKFDTKDTEFYTVMKNTLKYGLVDQDKAGTQYQGPYIFTNFPNTYDAFTFLVCVGEDVNVRQRPTTKAEVIGQLDYDVVKSLDYEVKDGWYKIQMPNGDRGYVAESLLRSPIDYRVNFSKYEEKWVFDFFVAGD